MTAWMNHPILPPDQLIQIPEDAVQGHRQMGWKVTDPPPDALAEAEASVAPDAGSVVEHPVDEPGKE